MRFYGLPYTDTLDLPVKTFWLLSANVDRIGAEEDVRAAQVAVMSQADSEGLKSFVDSKRSIVGTVALETPKRDTAKLMALKGAHTKTSKKPSP